MTRAAQAMGVTQPALSAVVKKLETEVGAELLHRTGRGVELTEAGRVFLAHAEESLRAAAAGVKAVRELAGLERGSIRVGGGATATTYLLPPVVSAVRKMFPGLRFYVREAGSLAVAAAVVSGELDLGIVTPPVGMKRGKWPMPGGEELLTRGLVEDELRLVEGTKGRRHGSTKGRGQAEFAWKELVGVPVVAFEAGSAVRDMIDSAAAAAGVTLNVVMELRSIESIQRMVSAGIGVGFVSRFALGQSEGRRCRDGTLTRTLSIVRRRDRVPSAAAAEFERRLFESFGTLRR